MCDSTKREELLLALRGIKTQVEAMEDLLAEADGEAKVTPLPDCVTKGQWMEWWNYHISPKHMPPLPKVRTLDGARWTHLKARIAENPDLYAEMDSALSKPLTQFVREKGFLNFPWLLKSPENVAKLLEGNYTDQDAARAQARRERELKDQRDERDFLKELEVG